MPTCNFGRPQDFKPLDAVYQLHQRGHLQNPSPLLVTYVTLLVQISQPEVGAGPRGRALS